LTEVFKAWMTEAELSEVGWLADRLYDGELIRLKPLRLAFEMTGTLLMR
jgi:hypothetical protein